MHNITVIFCAYFFQKGNGDYYAYHEHYDYHYYDDGRDGHDNHVGNGSHSGRRTGHKKSK